MILFIAKVILCTAGIIGIFLLYTLQKAKRSPLKTSLSLMILGSILWNITALASLAMPSFMQPLAPFVYASATLFFTARYWFVLTYAESESIKASLLTPSIALGIFFSVAAFIPGLLFSTIALHPDGYVIVTNGTLSVPFSLLILYFTLAPVFILAARYIIDRQKDAARATRSKLILIGLASHSFVSAGTNIILPIAFGIYQFNTIGPAFSLAFDAFILYAIFRHQFLEIKPYLQRGLIYTFIIASVLTLYTTLLLFLVHVANIQNTFIDVISAGIILMLGIFTIPQLEATLRRITDPWFFKNTYSYPKVAHELGTLFATHPTRAGILRHSLSFIRNTLHLTRCTFVPQGRKTRHADNTLTIPVPSTNGLVGTLLIGIKRSGDPLTNQDYRLLELYAALLGIALDKALLYEELENRVDARTAEVETLYKKQQTLYAELAHALQTPFTVLKGTFELVRKKAPTVNQEHLQAFEKSVQDTARLTNDLLLLSRHQLKENKKTHKEVSLSSITISVAEYVRTICETENITLRTCIADTSPILGAERDLEELVTNILSNAVRYTKGCNVRCITVSISQTNNAVRLVVADTGIGIPKEDLPHIFKRGYRSQAATDIDGSGIGLAIVKKIADVHGARITTDSTAGAGTQVTVAFPLTKN